MILNRYCKVINVTLARDGCPCVNGTIRRESTLGKAGKPNFFHNVGVGVRKFNFLNGPPCREEELGRMNTSKVRKLSDTQGFAHILCGIFPLWWE